MPTQEFYIRNETDTEARGPFNFEQLSSLADSGQVTLATLYYDATTEQWTPVESSIELKSALFPEKRKLSVRPKQQLPSLNQHQEGSAPITVGDMLAAAEGRTPDTKGKEDPSAAMAQAAVIGRWGAIVALLLAAAGEILPAVDVVMSMDAARILAQPLILLGALDLLLAVVLALGVVSVYPFVRFRAALGLGFLGFVFWTQGQMVSLAALAAACAGLYGCTIFVSRLPAVVAALLAVGGFVFVAWGLLS